MTENKRFKQVLFIFKMYYMIYLLLAFNAFVNGTVWMKYATILSAVWGAVLGLWMLKDYRLVSKGSESLAPGCVLTERGIQRGYEYKVWISGEYRRPCMDVYLFIYYIYTDLYV